MYQCFVSNEFEQIQSTAELQLGGEFEVFSIFELQAFYENVLNEFVFELSI